MIADIEDGRNYLIDLKNDLPVAILFVIILLSFVGGYFSSIYRPIYYSTSTLNVLLIYFLVAHFSIQRLRINTWIFNLIYFSTGIIILLILLQSIVNTYHLYIVFVVGTFILFNQYDISRKSLLRITNISFLIYLFFSILLYFGIIDIGRELNIFDAAYNILGIKTFIGLLGSTASIDSYATIMILINLYFNKARNKWILIFISALAALLTFRSSPYLVFFGPLIILRIISLFRKNQLIIFSIIGIIFVSSFLPSLIWEITKNEKLFIGLNFLLTGRASLWYFMIEKYFSFPLVDLLSGFGDTIEFEVYVWGRYTANPHNMYLKLLIVYGIILFVGFFLFLGLKFKKNTTTQLVILFSILLAGVGNSNIFSFMNLPLNIWFIALISSSRKNFKS